jgi:transposase
MASQTNIEQRCVIKYFVKVNEKYNKVYENLRNVCGDEAMSRTRVYEWYNQFKNGRKDVFDYERSGRPNTDREETNIITVQELITEDKSLSQRY